VPYASVVPLVTARAVARAFTYEVPEEVRVGAIVRVPFGRSRARGIVTELVDAAPPGVEARPVESVLGEIPPTLVELALWLADYYGSTPARALALVAPETPKRRKEQAPPAERQALGGEAAPARLSDEQTAAVARVVGAEPGTNLLLYGATGSGKTEVYLQACAAMLERGFGAIVLVPEIALAPQTVGRVRARFGDRVAILHSALTDAERRDERERIASGEARIVVGARSAVFAPIRGLGLIVVDEEHDASYKQDSDPRYDARTVAAKRAALEGAVAVYGSATPRPESWAALERLELGGRIGAELPPVRVVDLRREAGYPLSAPLLDALRRVAESRGKAILLLNRRGIAPALHCRACGTTIRCPNCDVALVLHGDSSLQCHHCGFAREAPANCPACGSPELARIGAGTQKLERDLARELPDLELIRLDADAVAKPEQLAALLQRFADAEGAVLLGTQMVAKGHHFSGVELAAVVDADTGMGLPDFRAEERTFQLITQLAGRSGRDAPGRVLVQTFQPDARPIVHAARHDVGRFLAEELERREALGYPPYAHVVRIVVTGPAVEPVVRALDELKAGMTGAELLGPAVLLRLRGKHRAQLVAKTDRPRALASQAAHLLAAAAPNMRRAHLTAVVDVDPQSV
jgi:primosomal protein N' (replication factor Y) (superfamily II helicase)